MFREQNLAVSDVAVCSGDFLKSFIFDCYSLRFDLGFDCFSRSINGSPKTFLIRFFNVGSMSGSIWSFHLSILSLAINFRFDSYGRSLPIFRFKFVSPYLAFCFVKPRTSPRHCRLAGSMFSKACKAFSTYIWKYFSVLLLIVGSLSGVGNKVFRT